MSHVILTLYVDDMLITSKNKDELSKLKENLSQTFNIKNLRKFSQKKSVNALTKPLPHDALEHCCHLMGIT